MINAPLIIDRNDGMGQKRYARIQIVHHADNHPQRWIIYGTPEGHKNARVAIAAYHEQLTAEAIETDLLEGGAWYQFGRSFSRHPH